MNKAVSFEAGTVRYKTVGFGRPLVFLHGFLEDSSIWQHIELDLNSKCQMIFIDLPGHGNSKNYGAKQTIASMAKAVHVICLEENIEKPIVFGHSMGGYVALELSKIFSIDIALIHSNFWEDSVEKRKERERLIKVVKVNFSLFVSIVIPNLFFQNNITKCKPHIKYLIASATELDVDDVCEITIAMRDRLNNSKVVDSGNVAIIQGANDPVFTKQMMSQQIKKLKTKPFYLEIDNCGHMGFIEQPTAFLDSIKLIIDKFSYLNLNN